jgi:hypothetical protein
MLHRLLPTLLLALTLPASAAMPREAIEVAAFQLVNDNRIALDRRVVSFGQVFRQGEVRASDRLTARLAGVSSAAQLDAKAFYPDGSVRHGVLAVTAPPMRQGGAIAGVITTGGPSPTLPIRPAPPPPEVRVDLVFGSGAEARRRATVSLSALMKASRLQPDKPWLHGPLVQERRYAAQAVNGVQVVFDVWTPALGPARVDVIFHNDSAQNPDIGTQVYEPTIRLEGGLIYAPGRLSHYAWANWRRTVSADSALPLRVVPDTRLLTAVGATPRYARVRPDPEATAKLHRLSVRDERPLGFAALTRYMPTTGGRADIGPLPTWAVFYLLDPSRQNHQTLFANADAAGGIPWHVRDMETGGPINIVSHPNVWLDGRGDASPGILNRKYYTLDTEWQPDDAHQPSLTYLPYLLTGSQYYRDELAMQAGYTLASIDPQARGGAEGLVLGSQVRAVAWTLRTLANAAYILPSDDPIQGYFETRLRANLREIRRRYVDGDELAAAGELHGYLPGPYAVEGATPPWQNDYLVMVLGWIDRMGFEDARPVLGWMGNFVAGRFTSGPRGYAPLYGTPYFLFVADPSSKQLLNRWSQAFDATFDPRTKPVTTLSDPDWGGGYAALARAALASLIDTTGSSRAREAYAYVTAHTPGMEANFATDPTFAIVPASLADR